MGVRLSVYLWDDWTNEMVTRGLVWCRRSGATMWRIYIYQAAWVVERREGVKNGIMGFRFMCNADIALVGVIA